MTIDLHSFMFSSLKTIHRVNLLSYFPFIINFRKDSNSIRPFSANTDTIFSGKTQSVK